MKAKYYFPDFLNIPSEDQRDTLPQFTQKGLDHEIDPKKFDKNRQFWAYIRDAAGLFNGQLFRGSLTLYKKYRNSCAYFIADSLGFSAYFC